MRLPAALGAWAEPLSIFEPEFASALGPLVRRLDQLISSHDHVAAPSGDFAGWDGLTNRGSPDRLLMSEWAIADEAPLEFLRRAVGAELLHLAPALQAETRRGRVAVLADTGPDQLGAPRLVQLAALVVLAARARAAGGELMLGILGTEPGTWIVGALDDAVTAWLAGRRARPAVADDVEAWREDLDEPDELWLLTGQRLARQITTSVRCVESEPKQWSDAGTQTVDVAFEGTRVELQLPRPDLAVRALRGGARRRTSVAPPDRLPLRCHHPVFTSAEEWLVCRGSGPGDVVALRPDRADSPPRVHRFDGVVLAAGMLSGRVIALVDHDGDVTVKVAGRRLKAATGVGVSAAQFGIDHGVRERLLDGLAPLYFDRGDFRTHLDGQWWAINDVGAWRTEEVVAIAPSTTPDQPWVATSETDGVHVAGLSGVFGEHVVLGTKRRVASSVDGRQWFFDTAVSDSGPSIEIDEGTTVLGIVEFADGPALVLRSRAGLVLRERSVQGTRTLTGLSGSDEQVALHPRLPWLAVRRERSLDIVDLNTDLLLRSVPDGPGADA